MKRYDMIGHDCEMESWPDGEYVEYDDVKELIEAAKSVIEEWFNPYRSYPPNDIDKRMKRLRKALEPKQ